jgi:hypothetical protein
MKKGLVTILLSALCAFGLALSPQSHAKRADAVTAYVTNPTNGESDAPVYPNPAQDHIFVRLDLINSVFMAEPKVEFEIRSLLGNSMPVLSEQVDSHTYRIATQDFPAGYYLLFVRCNECKGQAQSAKNVFKFLKK